MGESEKTKSIVYYERVWDIFICSHPRTDKTEKLYICFSTHRYLQDASWMQTVTLHF